MCLYLDFVPLKSFIHKKNIKTVCWERKTSFIGSFDSVKYKDALIYQLSIISADVGRGGRA